MENNRHMTAKAMIRLKFVPALLKKAFNLEKFFDWFMMLVLLLPDSTNALGICLLFGIHP